MIQVARIFCKKIMAVWFCASFWTSATYTGKIILAFFQILKTRSLMPADKLMTGRMCKFFVDGKAILWNGTYFDGAREIFCEKVYFSQFDANVKEGDQVIDLGAGVGDFAALCAVKGASVVAVEAQKGFIPIIHDNLNLNGLEDRVVVEWGLVGKKTGAFSDPENLTKASHFINQQLPELDLMFLLEKHQIKKVDFLKIDIEGSEFALFENYMDWLSSVRMISMEVHLSYGNVNDIINILQDNEFEVRYIDRESDSSKSISKIGFLFAKRT